MADAKRLRKRMVICRAIGTYQNGKQKGVLDRARLAALVANQKKHPRQIPVYLLTGKPDPAHPEDLDDRLADGWVEGLELQGDDLVGDVNVGGDAAMAVEEDRVRGASIGTVQGQAYDGSPIGEVLQHVVLTNDGFVKNLNIAASRAQGGEPIASFFTALTKEQPMAEPKKEPEDGGGGGGDDTLTLTERLKAAETLNLEQAKQIRDLSDANENLAEELKARQQNTDLETALKENRKLLRRLDATKVRELVSLGVERGQFKRDTVRGYDGGDDRSDEITLAWFKNSIFEGDMAKLTFALKTFPKSAFRRTPFQSGDPAEDGASQFTAEQKAAITAAGKDPELVAKTAGSQNFTEWKQRRKAAGKE